MYKKGMIIIKVVVKITEPHLKLSLTVQHDASSDGQNLYGILTSKAIESDCHHLRWNTVVIIPCK